MDEVIYQLPTIAKLRQLGVKSSSLCCAVCLVSGQL